MYTTPPNSWKPYRNAHKVAYNFYFYNTFAGTVHTVQPQHSSSVARSYDCLLYGYKRYYYCIAGIIVGFVGVNSSHLNFFFGFDLCGDDLPAGCPLDQSFIRFRFKMLVLFTKKKKCIYL